MTSGPTTKLALPSSKVGATPVESTTGIFPIIDSDHNSNEGSLFPSDDELTIIPPTDPPAEPLPPPAKPVPDCYWDRIKHEKRPARTVQLSYRERLDYGLVIPIEQSKR
jgi:hypothetical protein